MRSVKINNMIYILAVIAEGWALDIGHELYPFFVNIRRIIHDTAPQISEEMGESADKLEELFLKTGTKEQLYPIICYKFYSLTEKLGRNPRYNILQDKNMRVIQHMTSDPKQAKVISNLITEILKS